MSRTLHLRLTESATNDLAEIWAYIAIEASDATATRLISKLHAQCKALQSAPGMGAPRPALALGLRATFHGSYAIYYQVDGDTVFVVRVLHGARDASAIAMQGGFNE